MHLSYLLLIKSGYQVLLEIDTTNGYNYIYVNLMGLPTIIAKEDSRMSNQDDDQFECDECYQMCDSDELHYFFYDGVQMCVCDSCFNEKYEECSDCDCIYLQADMEDKAEKGYHCICQECFDEKYIKCSHCDEIYLKADMEDKEEKGYDCICPECFEESYIECTKCGEFYLRKYTKVKDEYSFVCDDCGHEKKKKSHKFNRKYEECMECGNSYLKEDMKDKAEKGYNCICQECFDEKYIECSKCGVYYLREDVKQKDQYLFVCEDCKPRKKGIWNFF